MPVNLVEGFQSFKLLRLAFSGHSKDGSRECRNLVAFGVEFSSHAPGALTIPGWGFFMSIAAASTTGPSNTAAFCGSSANAFLVQGEGHLDFDHVAVFPRALERDVAARFPTIHFLAIDCDVEIRSLPNPGAGFSAPTPPEVEQ